MTLADLIPQIEKANLTPVQRRDQISAVRTVARLLGADPGAIAADPAALRRRLETISPEAEGLSRGRWANLRSLLGKALEHGRAMMPGRRVTPISSGWQGLLFQLDENRRVRLSALVRHLSALGIEPQSVTLDDLLAYQAAMAADRLRRRPEKTWDSLIWSWNASVQEVSAWPQIVIPRKTKRTSYVMPWSAFPPSLKDEVDAFLRRQSGADLSEEGPLRALRPSSLETREYQLRVAASALAYKGVDPAAIISLADLVKVEHFRLILSFFLDRRDSQTSSAQISQMAGFLKSVADHWVKVEEADLTKLKRLTSRVAVNERRMTDKNRERLRPFNEADVVHDFLNLPSTIRDGVEKDRRAERLKAVRAQAAAAIAILLAAPIRIGNLAALDMSRHLIHRGGRLYLVIPPAEVKNRELIDFELPASTVEVLRWYVKSYRPHLLRGATDALFPGEEGAPKHRATLGPQICREVFRFTGLKVNPHLFRHIAAKIFLDARPGQYEVVRRLLGHKSLATTTSVYTGAESKAAGKLFESVIDDLRHRGRSPNQSTTPHMGDYR